MLDLLIGNLWGYVAAASGVIAAVLGIYFKGRSDAKSKAQAKANKEALETRSRIDEALDQSRAGGGDWYDRLGRVQPPKRKR